jgi:hypothetical protein
MIFTQIMVIWIVITCLLGGYQCAGSIVRVEVSRAVKWTVYLGRQMRVRKLVSQRPEMGFIFCEN